MKSSWRSPDGGSSVVRHTKIELCGAAFCAWWATGSTPIRSFHTVSEGKFSEVELPLYGFLGSSHSPGPAPISASGSARLPIGYCSRKFSPTATGPTCSSAVFPEQVVQHPLSLYACSTWQD